MTSDRRARFRECMRQLDPTGDPALAVAGGLYVPPPNPVSRQIATRIELQPGSSHLLVGGVGSGKTTELIAIERRLAEVDDLLPVRVDVPAQQQLAKLKPGVLIALAALEACKELDRERKEGLVVDPSLSETVEKVSAIARGYWDAYASYEPDPDDAPWVPGVLEAPKLSYDVLSLSVALTSIHGALQRKLVLLFDGLDRAADLSVLTSMLGEDVPAMGQAGVGSVVVGPQHLRFTAQRSAEAVFETVHLHGATAVSTEEGRAFLTAVLRARVDETMLPEESASALAGWSGGVLRDLVALAREAITDAYSTGADSMEPEHVKSAADRFGRALLLGSTKEMVERLKGFISPSLARRLHREKGPFQINASPFTVATDLDQRLLLERLVVEVPETPVRYVLHPAIVPLISGLGEA